MVKNRKVCFKKNNGASMVLVIVVASIMAILGAALGAGVIQWFRIVRGEETVGYTFAGAHSAVERSFYNIYDSIKNTAYLGSVPWTGNDTEYADGLIGRMNEDDAANPFIRSYTDIGIFEASSQPKVRSDIVFSRYTGTPPRRSADGGSLIIPVAVTVRASLENGIFSSAGRKVYAFREFAFPIPNKFKLNAAIYSIGDVFAVNGIDASITGDVNAFGTSPAKKQQLQQHYYGGIYAKRGSSGAAGSNLTIEGNAYTRSFIRAGAYSGLPDGSNITITRDAVAQSIQIFGNTNAILVGRNAYTFDDLEVDGENSVIGINGSFFGLSRGDGIHHDASSAIVNAAPIHYNNSDASRKSRIVINEDVLINGGTFKVDPVTGVSLYQIEDASIAWTGDTKIAAYKAYTGNPDVTDYNNYLKNSGTKAYGFLNLIQMWDKVSPDRISLGNWLANIRAVGATPGVNDWNAISGARHGAVNAAGGVAAAAKAYISGFANYAVAANDSMYFMDKHDISASGIKKVEFLRNAFTIDHIGDLSAPVTAEYWNDAAELPDADWAGQYCPTDGGVIKTRLQELKSKLYGLTEVFCTRDYPPETEGTAINTGEEVRNSFRSALGEIDGAMPENLFLYLQAYLNKYYHDDNPYVKINEDDGDDSVINIRGVLSAEALAEGVDYNGSYFLVINNDPEDVIKLDGVFNGIIFSLGRVEIAGGGVVNGAILAAGRGYEPVHLVGGSAAGYHEEGSGGAAVKAPNIPVVKEDGSNRGRFENGDYAGVVFDGSQGAGTDARVVFPGREPLLQKFLDEGISLYPIF